MKILKPVAALTLSALLGLVFLYSAYTKLLPLVETFEFTFVDLGLANWYTAPILARLVIGLEIFVGVLLISGYRLKTFTLPLAFFILVFFILYLIGSIVVNGNEGNCGCFGEHLRMTPFQAIFKNLVMIALMVPVYYLYEGWRVKYNALLLSLLAGTAFILPYVFNPVDYTYTSNNLEEKVGYKLDLDLLYTPEDSLKVEVPKVDLRKGKQVVAFLSITCSHCRVAAKKFRIIKKNNPALPVYFVLNGDKDRNYDAFISDTKATNIPSSFCLGKTFVQLASAQLPRIYYLDNAVVVKKVDYYELNQYDIEKWVSP